MIKIEGRRFNRWPADLRRHLLKLTLREGEMRGVVRDKPDCYTAVAFLDGKPVGWALVNILSNHNEGMFYVQRAYRRRGIGKMLYEKIRKRRRGFTVYPHDYTSASFFKHLNREEVE